MPGNNSGKCVGTPWCELRGILRNAGRNPPLAEGNALAEFFGVTQTGSDRFVIEYELLLSRRGPPKRNDE